MRYIWLIPLLPAAGALVNGLIGVRWFSRTVSGLLACATMAGALGLSIWAFAELLLKLPAGGARAYTVTLAQWIPKMPLATAHGIGTFEIPWAFRLDPLAGVMILVVSGVGFLIHVYSTAYMYEEPRGGYARFFSYLNLFCFFMLTLVLGANFLVMFVGWEGVGLCSYLLIGYWYEKKSASDAGKKAFITNRIGDWGFILGMFLVFFTFGTLDLRAVADAAATMPVEAAGFGTLSVICLCLFIGATGKSAQIPLYVWLPDAMEGPTPVSALIHAATMVTAGVYMVSRNAVLFEHAPMVMMIVAIIGVLTALMAATIGLVQNDIKRVLAYSTVSQLGYMFLATGVGAFAAAIFHLMTHAFFKALLFLGSGSVIHGMAGEQNMQRMGGLKKYMPVTFITMMIGTLAIAGIPPLSGFFSKDEILYRTFLSYKVIWVLAAATALMTAFYMLRLMLLTFYGTYRGAPWSHAAAHDPQDTGHGHGGGHDAWHGPHESPRAMTVPLMILAVGAVVAGFVGIPSALGGNNAIEQFLHPSFAASHSAVAAHEQPAVGPAAGEAATSEAARTEADGQAAAERAAEEHGLSRAGEIGLMLFSVLVAVGGIMGARHLYLTRPELPDLFSKRWSGAYTLLFNKYYVDELYDATAIKGTMTSSRGLWQFDLQVVDGAVNGTGWLTRASSWLSHMFDKYVVDGLVNLVGWSAGEGSQIVRRLQTGLVQNYALLMVFGVFALVTFFLIAL